MSLIFQLWPRQKGQWESCESDLMIASVASALKCRENTLCSSPATYRLAQTTTHRPNSLHVYCTLPFTLPPINMEPDVRGVLEDHGSCKGTRCQVPCKKGARVAAFWKRGFTGSRPQLRDARERQFDLLPLEILDFSKCLFEPCSSHRAFGDLRA